MISLATVGTSWITDSFLQSLKYEPRIKLKAVYSRTYEKGAEFAQKHNCTKVYTDLNLLALDDSVDAVYIASPNVCHYEQSKLFLENKKHVICEKPITVSFDEYKILKSIADKNNLIYMEAIVSRYSPARKDIFKALNELGNISVAKIDYCQYSSKYESFMRGEHQNIFDMSLHTGTLNDLGVYCVYAAVDMFGMPKSITAKASYFDNGADKSGCAIFDYDKFVAVLTYSKAGQTAIGSEIVGDKGTLKIGLVSQYADAVLSKGGENIPVSATLNRDELMSYEAKMFADFILNYEEHKNEYVEISNLAKSVHTSMDMIKKSADIKYV